MQLVFYNFHKYEKLMPEFSRRSILRTIFFHNFYDWNILMLYSEHSTVYNTKQWAGVDYNSVVVYMYIDCCHWQSSVLLIFCLDVIKGNYKTWKILYIKMLVPLIFGAVSCYDDIPRNWICPAVIRLALPLYSWLTDLPVSVIRPPLWLKSDQCPV